MHKLIIREPIWCSKAVGISEYNAQDDLQITISYKNKYHQKIYPATYTITKEKIITYPIKYCGKTKLYIIPIKDLTIKES